MLFSLAAGRIRSCKHRGVSCHGLLATTAADMIALDLVSLDDHDTAAAAFLVPALAAPAAVPAAVTQLKGTAWQRTPRCVAIAVADALLLAILRSGRGWMGARNLLR